MPASQAERSSPHNAPRARNGCRNGVKRMSAQWAAGDRPLLGPDDGAGSANRFDRHSDGQPGISAAHDAASDHRAGNTLVQRRLPDRTAKPAATATGTPGAMTPIPATPLTASAVPYGNGASTLSAPPAINATPGRAPLSGYSNRDLPPSSGTGSPAATTPGSGPAATYLGEIPHKQ